jgi:hypothetical protein
VTGSIHGQLDLLIDHVVELVTVEKIEDRWRLTYASGHTRNVSRRLSGENGPDEAS